MERRLGPGRRALASSGIWTLGRGCAMFGWLLELNNKEMVIHFEKLLI